MIDLLVIINPVSGSGQRSRGPDRVRIAERTFAALGVCGRAVLSERRGHAHDLALEAAASGVPLVMAWGGDGTVNEVGRALTRFTEHAAPGSSALGIVPGGSGNGLARELALPFEPARAIAHALAARTRAIDAGEIDGRAFFNVAGVGLDADVAAAVSGRTHNRGLLSYVLASTRHLFRIKATSYLLEVDGEHVPLDAIVIAVANSRQYGFGTRIAPSALYDDGWLDLVAVGNRGLAGNLVRVPSLFTGTFDRCRGVQTRRVRQMTITCSDPMLCHVDGEPFQGGDVLSVRVHPGALRLRA